MKKIFTFLIVVSLFLPLFSQAQIGNVQARIYTLVGRVTAINTEEKSFDLKIGWLAQGIKGFFAALFSFERFERRPALVYKVLTDENTSFTKKSTSGVVNGSFEDLKIGLRVQAKGYLNASSDSKYRAIVKARSVFILTPSTGATTTTFSKYNCINDEDCTWCGMDCVSKEYLRTQKVFCAQVMPPEWVRCGCMRLPNMSDQQCVKIPIVHPTEKNY